MASFARKMERQQMKVSSATQHRLVRDHLDVLQNIEGVFVAAHRETPAVDDAACHAALAAMLTYRPADDPVAGFLLEALKQMREVRAEVSNPTWEDALRVVAESIRTHSDRRPGRKDYLNFVNAYIV